MDIVQYFREPFIELILTCGGMKISIVLYSCHDWQGVTLPLLPPLWPQKDFYLQLEKYMMRNETDWLQKEQKCSFSL